MASLMPTGSPETFTGANGAAPNATNITQALNEGSGGGLSIQSNQLRVRTGTTSGNRTSLRITGLSVANVETVFTWTVAANLYGQVMLRSSTAIDTGTGYQLSLVANDMTLARRVSYAGPNLQTVSHGFTVGQVVRTRVAIFGQTIYARTWLASASEPTSLWQLVYTDAGGVSAAGSVGWTASSASAGSKDLFIDNIDVTDTLTPTVATLLASGSVTPAGALLRSASKTFSGSVTPAGTLTRMKVVARSFLGTITPTGTLRKAGVKVLAGSVTAAGTVRRQPAKRLAGTVTPAASLRRAPTKRMSGSITPAGSSLSSNVGRIFGRPGVAVMRLVERAEVRIRYRKG